MIEDPVIPQIKVSDIPPASVKKPKKGLLITLAILGIILIYSVISGLIVYGKAMSFKKTVNGLMTAGKSQDLVKIKAELVKTKSSLKALKSSFVVISPFKLVPFFGSYVSDANHLVNAGLYGMDASDIVLTTIEPYADLLGLTGGKDSVMGDGTKTAKDRIDFIVKSIPDLIPNIDKISGKTALIEKELTNINSDRYPVRIGKTEVRSKVKSGLEMFSEAAGFITNGKPLLEAAPYLLGIDSERTYLLLFQNDKELRPTGGFMTGYSIMKVNKGAFSPVSSSDIYNLDAKYKPTIVAPDPIIKYLKGPYALSNKLRLRDMNWSPDFAESMRLFTTEAESIGITGIDGIISVDTQVLVYLLDAIGKIGVPGFGNFSTEIDSRCNCPNVIYELEAFADVEGPVVWDPNGSGKIIYAPANYDNRKKIIGPLMNSVLANAMGQPKDKLPKLFEAGFKSLIEKHILFYIFDSKTQDAVSSFGIAGTIKSANGDYLHINDANLGGRKSNLYVTNEIFQEYSTSKDGYIEKTLTLTYKNPMKQDGWLNSVLPDWVRIYVPKGSTLISFDGVEDKATPYEEFGKTVFAGFFKLRPEGVSKLTIKYKLPIKAKGEVNLLIQKQPGLDS
ncbi:MAG: hypothetical protein UT44_C0056G0007 [Candidatus Levybacteria bacterium GW2011_GWA1_39_32]|nr:MAG: hypothetical protein UT44_C0056G0007 [Candidatus Levybacteria bacterium GW2011_GWA1_39_32]